MHYNTFVIVAICKQGFILVWNWHFVEETYRKHIFLNLRNLVSSVSRNGSLNLRFFKKIAIFLYKPKFPIHLKVNAEKWMFLAILWPHTHEIINDVFYGTPCITAHDGNQEPMHITFVLGIIMRIELPYWTKLGKIVIVFFYPNFLLSGIYM